MPNPDLERLVELQVLDDEVARLAAAVRACPEALASEERDARAESDRAKAIEAALAEMKKELARLEMDLKTVEDKSRKAQVQRNQSKANEEYTALTREIDHAKSQGSDLETKILLAYEAIEGKKAELERGRDRQKAQDQRLQAARAKIRDEQQRIEKDLAAARARRNERARSVSADAISVYDRIRKRTGDRAIVRVDGENCAGCHVALTSALIVQVVSADKGFACCPSCARILYVDAPPAQLGRPSRSDDAFLHIDDER